MDLSRQQFLRLWGAGLGALALSPLASCGEVEEKTPDAPPGDAPKDAGLDAATDGPPADAPMGNCAMNGTAVTIGTNHGHTMAVPAADIAAGVAKTYQIQGTSGHPHTVVVTAAMFAMLQQNMQVMGSSSVDASHAHQFTIKCA